MEIEIRQLQIEHCIAASRLINEVAEIFIAPDFSASGMNHFLAFVRPNALCERLEAGALILGAWEEEELAGIIELREGPHIALLFTATDRQGRGIAKKLVRNALSHYSSRYGAPEKMTVNASLFAVPVYQKLGFRITGQEEDVNGVRFIPMAMQL